MAPCDPCEGNHVWDHPEAHFVLITSLSPSTHTNMTRLEGLVVINIASKSVFYRLVLCRFTEAFSRKTTYHICMFASLSRVDISHFPSLSDCSAGNVVKMKQLRKRLIIQQPKGGRECPRTLEEQRDCELPKTCPGFR